MGSSGGEGKGSAVTGVTETARAEERGAVKTTVIVQHLRDAPVLL